MRFSVVQSSLCIGDLPQPYTGEGPCMAVIELALGSFYLSRPNTNPFRTSVKCGFHFMSCGASWGYTSPTRSFSQELFWAEHLRGSSEIPGVTD